ncbi:hypothetical protein HYPSUDRAFT_209322 [Hypholoma sublateritium FD-334 SS-4]|uniref:Uncharacterized protein n=1 Tax=Hypholoma sublateritium (strain FD-334 SS-4) TaxID=945553 RepID=A0A0D2N3A3_HYPSF|nr:hypothetical protein HYPSUDRAFT_209322 [Hypholoma sublateritium FD-334 SS-4]
MPQALQREEHPSQYGALQEYQVILLQAIRSIVESDSVMLKTIVRDLEDSLPSFEETFKSPTPPQVLASVQVTSHMFQNARGVVVSGGQFIIQNTPDNGSSAQSDKLLQRLNCLIVVILFDYASGQNGSGRALLEGAAVHALVQADRVLAHDEVLKR